MPTADQVYTMIAARSLAPSGPEDRTCCWLGCLPCLMTAMFVFFQQGETQLSALPALLSLPCGTLEEMDRILIACVALSPQPSWSISRSGVLDAC